MHPVVELADRLADAAIPYPPGVVPVPHDGWPPIRGTAFFPGGYGLWRPDPSLPLEERPNAVGGVMWVGNNFGSEEYVARRARLGSEVSVGTRVGGSTTWRQLLPLMGAAGMAPEDGFFTNAYMGLLKGSQSNLARFPGTKPGGPFDAACAAFMAQQIAVMRPRVLVALGKPARRFLGRVGRDAVWASKVGFTALDATGSAVTTLAVEGRRIPAVALLHPSYREVNLRARPRVHRGVPDLDAEMLLLREALELADAAR